ncbi:hypothetical protein GGR58DRAFT_504703 [Xylaria digitata]|nr:hypothetical protein GGR58DRAFT_504703 [Xylaria digitata]
MRFPFDRQEVALTLTLDQILVQLDGTTNVIKLPATIFHSLNVNDQAIAKNQASLLLGHPVEFYLDSRNPARVYLASIENINHNWPCEARYVEGQTIPMLFDAIPNGAGQRNAVHNNFLHTNLNPLSRSLHIPSLVSQPEVEVGESSNSTTILDAYSREIEPNRRALCLPKSAELVEENLTELSPPSQPNRGQIEGAHNNQHTPPIKSSNDNSTKRIQGEIFQSSRFVAAKPGSLDGPAKNQGQ